VSATAGGSTAITNFVSSLGNRDGLTGIGTQTPATTLDVNGSVTLEQGTAGAVLCLTAAKVLGHCTADAACTSTCTCTCVAD
jgi:hypothetical protein